MENDKATIVAPDNGVGTQETSGFTRWWTDLMPKRKVAGNDIAGTIKALRTVTLLQWAMFFSGCVTHCRAQAVPLTHMWI